tara:strand:- start:464 stop:670 length:207 start_codon:yes stop_codon:yes gene_type:complete
MVSIAEIQESAARLEPAERAELAVFLLDSLGLPLGQIDDSEVDERTRELESGAVCGLSHDEFMKAVAR